jgi:heat shock protein HtpX
LGVVLGFALGPVAGVVVAAVVAVAVALFLFRRARVIALAVIGGRRLPVGTLPALVNQVEGLSATIGVARPVLWLVDDPVPNACAFAGRTGAAVLVVTSGLVDRLGLIEMEGVLAHELVHVKRHDAVVSAVAVATAGVVARLTGHDGLVHWAVGRGREYGADRAAALAVRYPPGLHDALAAISLGPRPGGDSVFTGRRWAATRWVWIDPMVGAPERTPVGELDATDVRVAALAEY